MKYIWILALCVMPSVFHAQSTVLHPVESDSVHPSKVLVVPFQQTRYYFSDCDRNIAAESKLKMPEVRNNFRFGFDYATEARFDKQYEPMNMAQMKDSMDVEWLADLYQNVTYSYQTPARLNNKVGKGIFGKVKQKFAQIGQKEKPVEVEEEEAYTQVSTKDDQYMELNWNEASYLEALVSTYEPNYIVTINQFEIKTDYERCIDRELGNYTRRLKIHYNVFDDLGNRIAGDVITAKYNSTTDDIHRIIQDNFGILAEYIMHTLPRN